MFKLKDWIPYRAWRHPVKATRDWYRFMRSRRLRAKRGWAPCDTWSMDTWFLQVIPEMLHHLANHSHTYPPDFDDFERWSTWLHNLADEFEWCREGNLDNFNQYATAYYAGYDKDMKEKYWKCRAELEKEREARLKNAFMQFHSRFWSLWD